ncbi:MAG: gamma-glutamyltransferase [Phycisphaerales bacterium]|jgi:gamma-glutamyltranspeptidase/glutathione hydrolase|nr:gamma-glutamyltransferase [Phycisphaerales bacterium]
MDHCIVAAGTPSTAAAGAAVREVGGNAVDAAVAAAIASWVCEPGMTATGSAVLALVRPAGGEPLLVDGLTAMPGLGGHVSDPPGGQRVVMDYGPGVETGIGPGSVAVPGGPAALGLLQREWGLLAWADVVEPAIRLAAGGFPWPGVSAIYFPISGELIYDLTPGSSRIWRGDGGRPRRKGEVTTLPDLAADLELLAEEGSDVLYTGPLGERIGSWITENGGALSPEDLAAYRVEVRKPLLGADHGWQVAMADTIGGEALGEIVAGFAQVKPGSDGEAGRLVSVMSAALHRRDQRLARASASTTQICAVDRDGNACSITTSTGYGAGVVVPGTGVMLNNMLGELELLPNGPDVLQPGERLPSNMTPMVASRGRCAVAIGAAGADRIAPAIAQVWRGIVARGESVEAAVAAPRFHVRESAGEKYLDHEPGFHPYEVGMPVNPFQSPHMYFGGVQAAAVYSDGRLDAGSDPRRGGAVIIG